MEKTEQARVRSIAMLVRDSCLVWRDTTSSSIAGGDLTRSVVSAGGIEFCELRRIILLFIIYIYF